MLESSPESEENGNLPILAIPTPTRLYDSDSDSVFWFSLRRKALLTPIPIPTEVKTRRSVIQKIVANNIL